MPSDMSLGKGCVGATHADVCFLLSFASVLAHEPRVLPYVTGVLADVASLLANVARVLANVAGVLAHEPGVLSHVPRFVSLARCSYFRLASPCIGITLSPEPSREQGVSLSNWDWGWASHVPAEALCVEGPYHPCTPCPLPPSTPPCLCAVPLPCSFVQRTRRQARPTRPRRQRTRLPPPRTRPPPPVRAPFAVVRTSRRNFVVAHLPRFLTCFVIIMSFVCAFVVCAAQRTRPHRLVSVCVLVCVLALLLYWAGRPVCSLLCFILPLHPAPLACVHQHF